MQIILLERIEKLGQMGDLVNVKTGYARNFLIPQGKALRATKANTDRFEAERAQREANNLERCLFYSNYDEALFCTRLAENRGIAGVGRYWTLREEAASDLPDSCHDEMR